jgi:hypothetical protein
MGLLRDRFIRCGIVATIFFACLWALGAGFFKSLVIGGVIYVTAFWSIGSRWIERGSLVLLVYSLALWIGVAPSPREIQHMMVKFRAEVVALATAKN